MRWGEVMLAVLPVVSMILALVTIGYSGNVILGMISYFVPLVMLMLIGGIE